MAATSSPSTPPPISPRRVALADGRAVTIRELVPDDGDALVAAIEAADPVDLRRRFMGCPPPVSMLVDRLEAADGMHNLGLGAFADDGALVGVAQFDRDDDEPTAEIAVQVQTGWQNRGLGTALVIRLAEVALERGVHHFTGIFLAENQPLRRLLKDVTPFITTTYEQGEGHVDLDLDDAQSLEGEHHVQRADARGHERPKDLPHRQRRRRGTQGARSGGRAG